MRSDTTERAYMLYLINEYFEGRTSIAQENELRNILAATGDSSPEVAEAKAVMGVFAAARAAIPASTRRRRLSIRPLASAVAAIAILLACAAVLTTGVPDFADDNLCYASVGNIRIDDPEIIRQMMISDLRLMSEASEHVSSEVDDQFRLVGQVLDDEFFDDDDFENLNNIINMK